MTPLGPEDPIEDAVAGTVLAVACIWIAIAIALMVRFR